MYSYNTATSIVVVLALLIGCASLQQEDAIAKIPLRRFSFHRKGNMRIDAYSGLPLTIHDVGYHVEGTDDPKEVADSFLEANIATLRKNKSAKENIVHHKTVAFSEGGAVVRYKQHCEETPVYNGGISVTVNSKHTVSYVSNNLKSHVCSLSTGIHPIVNEESAIEAALGEIRVSKAECTLLEAKLVIFADVKESLLAWLVRLSSSATEHGNQSLEFLYDATNGENIQIKNLIFGKTGGEIRKGISRALRPSMNPNDDYGSENKHGNVRRSLSLNKEASNLLSYLLGRFFVTTEQIDRTFVSFEDGTGTVFNPDPLSTAQAKYFDDGYSDNCDENSPELEAELKTVTLKDLSLNSDGKCSLHGRYAAYDDFASPYKCDSSYVRKCDDFISNREESLFEAVNAYYHIDTMMRYIHDDLNITVGPLSSNAGSNGGVKYDPHGLGCLDDNSYYDTYQQRMAFGLGGVDDAEDSHVVVHELGHGLHDWLTDGGLSQQDGLSEGFGDYLAMSYTRSMGFWTVTDPQYHWVFPWDGHNEFWKGRSTNVEKLYPDDLSYSIHENGEIWSTCNMKVWDALGRLKSDKIHLYGLSYTGSSTNQDDAAHAIITAAKDLEYSEEDIAIITSIFADCGYSASCGDGIINGNDECDGTNIGNATCKNGSGCENGVPSCTTECILDYSNCTGSEYQSVLKFTLSTGVEGHETSWSLFNSNNTVQVSGENYESDEMVSLSMCLLIDECYRFEIYDINGDGLGSGDYDLVLDGVPVEDTDPSFTFQATHYVGACDYGISKDCSAIDEDLIFFGLTLVTDGWGTETTWDLYEETSNDLIDSGGTYESSSIYRISNCLPEDECYVFTIRDSNNDGICCAYGFGAYNLVWNGTVIPNTDPTFSEYATHKFGSCND